jgi:hypothetical protein
MDFVEFAARLSHECNRAYCESIGDFSQPEWKDAPEWQKESARSGIRFLQENPETTPEQSHRSWMRQKIDDGWVYGPVKDPEKKEHPCMVPYEDLPDEQRAKDGFFIESFAAAIEIYDAQSSSENLEWRIGVLLNTFRLVLSAATDQ